MIMVRMQVSLESLIEAIAPLDVEVKRKLMEIIEDQIFEAAEESIKNDPEVLAEVEEARKAYQIGDYQTIQEYINNQEIFDPIFSITLVFKASAVSFCRTVRSSGDDWVF